MTFTDAEFALVLRPGEHLSRRAVSSPNGEYSVVHQHDGNVVVYCNADQSAEWATGTNFQGAVWSPATLGTSDLDRAYGRAGRLALEEDGDLVVYCATGQRLWTMSRNVGGYSAALMIQNNGRLVLRSAEGIIPWSSHWPRSRWSGWNQVSDGRRLRRGQRLRNGSLVSDSGEYAFVVGEDTAAYLCRTDAEIVWVVENLKGDGFELTDDGRLVTRGGDGSERPAQALNITESVAAELAKRDAADMRVTDDGKLVIVDGAGAVIWTMQPAFVNEPVEVVLRKDKPEPQLPAGVPPLPAGQDMPVVRTDFSDDAAWREAVARVSAGYEWYGDEEPLMLDVTPIDDRRYKNLTSDQVAALVPPDVRWPILAIADALTMASAERHMMLVDLDEDGTVATGRATPAGIVEVGINLWQANMDWSDFFGDPVHGQVPSDQILRASEIEDPDPDEE